MGEVVPYFFFLGSERGRQVGGRWVRQVIYVDADACPVKDKALQRGRAARPCHRLRLERLDAAARRDQRGKRVVVADGR